MVIKDPKRLTTILLEASRIANVKVIVQNGWTKLGEELQKLSDNVMVVGPMPHDYLFEQVCGVIHHGGAGTTSAGLRAGNPTFICPFFGDQHFWAEMVHRSGVGPKECAVRSLTIAKLVDAFKLMQSEATVQAVRALSKQMNNEDGTETARRSFYRHLPTQHMLCDVSRYGYEPRQYKLASVYCFNCGLKLCQEADFLLHLPGSNRSDHVRTVYVSKIWDATVNTIASHNNKISSITNSGLDDPSSDIDNVTKLALEELTVRNQVEYQEHSNNNSSNNNNRYGNTGSPQKSPAEAFLATQSPSPTRQAAPSARIGQGLKTPTPSPSIANTTSTYETNPFNFMKNSAITFDRTMIFRLDAELSKAKSTSESYFTSDIVEIEYAYYKCKQFLLTQAMISFSNSLDMPSIQGPSGKVELSKADEEAVLFHIQSLGYNVNVSPAERSQLIRSFLSSSEATTLSFEVKNVVAENQATASIHTTVASRMITNTNNKKDIKPDILMDAVFGYADSPVSPLYTEAPSSLSSGFAEGMSNMLTGATGASAIALYVPMKCTVSGYRKYGAVGAVGGFLGGVCIGPLMATSYMLYGTGIGFRQMGRGIAGIKPPAGDTDGTSNSKRRRPSGTVVKGSITTNEPDSDEDDDDDGDDTMDLTDDIDDQISDTNTTISTMPDSARRNQFIFDEPATSTLFSYTGIDSSSAILTHLDLYIEQDIHADNDIADDPLRRKSVLEDYL